MCEILPEVNKCCFVVSLRLGCLYIAVLSIMSGVLTLSSVERTHDADYDHLKNVTEITGLGLAYNNLSSLISAGIAGISLVYILSGFSLIFGVVTREDGLIQLYVWSSFLAVLFGFFLIVMVGVECTAKTSCSLKGMDWLSASFVLTMAACYLGLWFYLICVANSLVTTGGA